MSTTGVSVTAVPALRTGASARAVVGEAKRLRDLALSVVETAETRRATAREAFESAREGIVKQQMNALPLARLRETTNGGLRLGAIESAGYKTVGAAAAAGVHRLEQLHGVGPQTAFQVVAAARQLELAMSHGV